VKVREGAKPLSKTSSPSPSKERGTKGVRLTKNYLPFPLLRGRGLRG